MEKEFTLVNKKLLNSVNDTIRIGGSVTHQAYSAKHLWLSAIQ